MVGVVEKGETRERVNGNVPLRRGGREGGGAVTERASEGGREALVGEGRRRKGRWK